MGRRKPGGVSWEDWTSKLIREGIERGDFENLPGAGKPIPGLDGRRDELWWVNRKLREEDIDALPPSLAVRRDRDQLLAALASIDTEDELRAALDELNARIRHLNRYGGTGPPSTLLPLDVEDVVERWRVARVAD